ncbi:FABP family protein [Allonocardiopsis opalescens]|uniref:Ferric nitrobindin-like protein n=1 Tax=Allonocardiopsis opalescens TaxID=1144618 RepID=A0A2T0QA96_9ACTN|nr:FABP family protein [Allonocardiopsis opalescens]PRY00767.1 uncharacterized protein DUF1794 [Allonocardiopsis opalescens]
MDTPLHPALERLSFLLGVWEGAGVGGHATMDGFRFGQEVTFTHTGRPYLVYTSTAWRLDDDGRIGETVAAESGFWRPVSAARPGADGAQAGAEEAEGLDNGVEVLLTHPEGYSEVYVGTVAFRRVELHTDVVARTETAHEVTGGHRLYGMIGEDLGYAWDIAAFGEPLQSYLSAQLKRVR